MENVQFFTDGQLKTWIRDLTRQLRLARRLTKQELERRAFLQTYLAIIKSQSDAVDEGMMSCNMCADDDDLEDNDKDNDSDNTNSMAM